MMAFKNKTKEKKTLAQERHVFFLDVRLLCRVVAEAIKKAAKKNCPHALEIFSLRYVDDSFDHRFFRALALFLVLTHIRNHGGAIETQAHHQLSSLMRALWRPAIETSTVVGRQSKVVSPGPTHV